jgi:hypothetical protein
LIRSAHQRLARRWVSPAGWLLLAAATAAVAAGTWILTDRSLSSLAVSVVSVGGAGLAVWLVPRHPGAAFGVLLLLAVSSGVTLELPPGTMRLEQPGILAVGLALLLGRRTAVDRPAPILVLIGLAALTYVGVLAASSGLLAPEPMKSLLMTGWTGLSIVGGALAYILLRRDPAAGARWLLIAALVTAVAGTLNGLLYWLFGPAWHLAIQGASGPMPKVTAFAWEPNLYASFLAGTMPFAAAPLIGQPTRRKVAILALLLLAMALAMTRGAYLGMAAGAVGLLGLVAWRTRAFSRVALVGLMIGTFTAVGVGLYAVTMPHPGIVARILSSPSDVLSGSPYPSTVPAPVEEYPDTVRYRLERVPVAINDLIQSPLIGLGAASFGQRHLDPSRPGMPDHIAILAVAALYEAGVIGAGALVLLFALVAVALLRALAASPDLHDAAMTGAYAAAVVTLLVAYQATNAIHFALNWLLIGAALAWSVAILHRRTGHTN